MVVSVALYCIPTPTSAQDNSIPPCEADDVAAVLVEITDIRTEYLEVAGSISADIASDPRLLQDIVALKSRWWEDIVPSFARCTELVDVSLSFGRLLDETIILLGLRHAADGQRLRGNERSFQALQSLLESQSELFGSVAIQSDEDVSLLVSVLNLESGGTQAVTATPILEATGDGLPIFTDDFANPETVRTLTLFCSDIFETVLYPPSDRPREAIELLAGLSSVEDENLELLDAMITVDVETGTWKYPILSVGDVSAADVDTSRELMSGQSHLLVFIPLPGGEFYRVEHTYPDFSMQAHTVLTSDVEQLFQLMDADGCLEDLEEYAR